MNKAANIYWDNSQRSPRAARQPRPTRKPESPAARQTVPPWLSFLIVTSIFFMLVVSINYRAFADASEEVEQNSRLTGQVQNLIDENLALQEEIHLLKTDPQIIQREARRIGIGLRPE